MRSAESRFKRFTIRQDRCAMKVGTDAMLFGAWVEVASTRRILDVGTGTGVLALIAAQRAPGAVVDAVEIDDEAAAQATENVAASPWPDRIRVHRMDVRRMRATDPFDLILCNPPYYAGYSTPDDPRIGVAKHSAELTLTDLIAAVHRLMTIDGRVAMVIPMSREQVLCMGMAVIGLSPRRRCAVRYVAHRPAKRVMLEFDRSGKLLEDDMLTVEVTGRGDHTSGYRELLTDLVPDL